MAATYDISARSWPPLAWITKVKALIFGELGQQCCRGGGEVAKRLHYKGKRDTEVKKDLSTFIDQSDARGRGPMKSRVADIRDSTASIQSTERVSRHADFTQDTSARSSTTLMLTHRLPTEVLLHILSFLDPDDLAACQRTNRKLLHLGRDSTRWKQICFDHSRAEAARRRQELLSNHAPVLSELRRALGSLPGPFPFLHPSLSNHASDGSIRDPASLRTASDSSRLRHAKAFAAWDPTAPGEEFDWYEEYIHRHGPLSLSWLETPQDGAGDSTQKREALGMGVVYACDTFLASQVIAPLDDGSICLWNLQTSSMLARSGNIVHRTSPGLVHIPLNAREETGAIENVSVDSHHATAYIATANILTEIDLNTLKVKSSNPFPYAISAISPADPTIPLTVGTLHTLHQFDPRVPPSAIPSSSPVALQQIAGANRAQPIPLSQPGPLALLHTDPNALWVAGRFTSLLHYDRRFWPRISSTIFSGARLSSLSLLPKPFAPPLSMADSIPACATGHTLVAAGAYKGKGSLETYPLLPTAAAPSPSLLSSSFPPSPSTLASSTRPSPSPLPDGYKNRQSASRSRLLHATPHGARLLLADGDGALKWLERDASTPVRSATLADLAATSHAPESASASDGEPDAPADVAVRLVPAVAPRAPTRAAHGGDVLLQTDAGRVGVLGFRRGDVLAAGHVCGEDAREVFEAGVEGEAGTAERARRRRYAEGMRRALEGAERELWWVRGLGL